MLVYVDASVVGGCEDIEFRDDSLKLWSAFVNDWDILLSKSERPGRCCVKTFDCVEFMRQRRGQIDCDDEKLDWRSKREKTSSIVHKDPVLSVLLDMHADNQSKVAESAAVYGKC